MGCGASARRYEVLEGSREAQELETWNTTSLREYFQSRYKQGATFEHDEYQEDDGEWCWEHKKTKIKVWKDAIDLSQGHQPVGSVKCCFHYTSERGFRNITNAKKEAVEIFASLIIQGEKATAWWGQGVYTVRKAPHEWPDLEALLDNNFRNMLARDAETKGLEVARKEYWGRIAYCIPILAFESCIYDVSMTQTPEMKQQGRPPGTNLAGKQLNEPGKANRECMVVRVEHEEEISNASAVLLQTLPQRSWSVQRRFGPDHLNTMGAISRLANVLKDRGLYEEAEPLFQRALQGMEELRGADDPATLTAANSLALLLEARYKLSEAEPLLSRALEGRQRKLGVNHPDTLEVMNNLAKLLQAQGKNAEAERIFRRALEGCEEKLGARHPHTLTLMNNLAGVLHVQGKLSEAAPLFAQALEGREAELGQHHPDTLATVNNFAVLLEAQGNFEEAEPLLWRGLEGYKSELGNDHPDTLAFVNNLAHLLQAQGRLQEAEELYRQGLQDCQAKLGSSHPHTLTLLSNLANLVHVQGKLMEAEPLLLQAMEGCDAKLGPEHPLTLVSVNGLALVFEAQDKLSDAEPLFRRALEGNVAKYGAEHPHSVLSLENLGCLLQRQGNWSEAESHFRQLLELREKTLGPTHPDTLQTANNLALVLESQKAVDGNDDVEPIVPLLTPTQPPGSLTRVTTTTSSANSMKSGATLLLEVEEKDSGASLSGDGLSLVSATGLAFMLEARGDFSEAEPLYRQALQQREAKLGLRHPHTLRSLESLARLCQDQGKYLEAETLWRRALSARESDQLNEMQLETLTTASNLASLLESRISTSAEVEQLHRRVWQGRSTLLGAAHPKTQESLLKLTNFLEGQGAMAEAEELKMLAEGP